jgi:tetratricopeptide (TPR) repeat protein
MLTAGTQTNPAAAGNPQRQDQLKQQTQPSQPGTQSPQNRAVQQPIPKRDLAAALRAVRPMLRANPERAIEMLRALDAEYPNNTQVTNLLGEAYMTVEQTDSAIAVYERSIRLRPTDVRAGAALGTIYVRTNRNEEGERVFRTLLNNTKNSVNTYRTIGSALSRAGYYDMALVKYIEGRTVNKNNYVLTLDIGHLQKTMGNFDAALDEYLIMIETSPKQFRLARDRILDLLRDPRAEPDSLLARLDTAAAADTPYRKAIMNVLALGYLEQGMIESALEVALEAEKIGTSDGKILFNLAEHTVNEYRRQAFADRTKYFELGLRALEAFIDGHPQSPQLPRAKLMLIDLLVDFAEGRVEKRGMWSFA